MYGFQPKSARGKTVQQLADGGMVHSIKGMLGLRPKTREELLAADAKAQARNQEAAGRVAERSAQQPAPATPAPPAAISDYSGMNAMQRREKEQGLKNGGMVKPHGFKAGGMILGPGTGTSDSIETEKRPGTFIMPADSTQAIGPDALEELGESEEMGAEAVPVRLSNGEFEFTPEQVQALGEAVLTVMRDATHERAEGQQKAMPKAAGFAPAQVFADGGMIENDVTRVGNSYSGGNVGGSVSINGQAGAGTMSAVPAPVAPAPAPAEAPAAAVPTPAATATPATTTATPAAAPAAPMGWAERNAQRSNQVTASSIMDSPERRAAQAKLSPTPAPVAPVAPTTPAVGGIQSATTAMDATKPKPFGAQPTSPFGFKPRGYANGGTVQDEQFFATGGSVQDPEELRKMIPQVEAMGYKQAPAAAPAAPATPAAPVPAAPAPAAKDPPDGGAAFGVFPQLAGGKRTTYAMDDKLRTGVQATGPSTFVPAKPSEKTIVGGGDGKRMNAMQDPRSFIAGSGSVANAPGQEAAPGSDRGPANPPAEEANAPEPANAQPALGAAEVTAQNDAAAQALSATPAAPAGFQPAGVQTPVVRNSTNDWAARKALENAATAASSITANGGRFDQNGRAGSPQAAAYSAALANDFALQQAQPGLDQTAMRENGANQRAAVQDAGATTRTGMTEQGSNTREAGRNALQRDEFNLRREASGFQTRAAAQQEQLRNVLLDPNASPEQRKIAQRSLAALSGKTAADRMQVVNLPDTVTDQGVVAKGGQALIRTLEDGTVEQVPIGGQQKAAPPPTRESLTKGQVVNLPDGRKGRWNGSSFELVG